MMPKIAGDPLSKVTLNLFTADVEWFQQRYGQGWSTELRSVIHRFVSKEDGHTLRFDPRSNFHG